MEELETANAAAAQRPQGLMDDPTIKLLVLASFLALIVLLSAVVALVWYSTRQAGAPRSQVEHDLAVGEAAVKEQPKDAKSWLVLASAQARSGQYSQAEATIKRGQLLKDTAALALVYADIAERRGDHDEAIKRYETAKKKAIAEYEALKKRAEEAKAILTVPNESLATAMVEEARIYAKIGKLNEARSQFDQALKEEPMMADVLVERGDVLAKLGETEAAAADFKTALRYDPNSKTAKAGLARLGEETR